MEKQRILLFLFSTTLFVVRSSSTHDHPKHEIVEIGRRLGAFAPHLCWLGLHTTKRPLCKPIRIRRKESPGFHGGIEEESTTLPPWKNLSKQEYPHVVVIGGSGFLGSEIRQQLEERGVDYTATSTSGDGEVSLAPLDLTASDAEEKFYRLLVNDASKSNRKISIISAMGVIGTKDDEYVNSALVNAIRGANRANQESERISRFVMIGNPRRVRRLSKKLPFLRGYANGKEVSSTSFFANSLLSFFLICFMILSRSYLGGRVSSYAIF